MLEVIKEFLDKKGWTYSKVEGADAYSWGVTGKNGNFHCSGGIVGQDFLIFSFCGVTCPDEKKTVMSELLLRLNKINYYGYFSLDYTTGQIDYGIKKIYGVDTLTVEIVENLVMTNIWAMDRSLPGIIGLIYEGLTPIQAFELVNNPVEPTLQS